MTLNHSKIEVQAEEIKYNNVNVTFYILSISATLYHTYQQLYCIGHIQMTNNFNREQFEKRKLQSKNINITLRIYTTLYHSYQQLHYTGHIQMTSNYSTLEEQAEEIKHKNETSYSIY